MNGPRIDGNETYPHTAARGQPTWPGVQGGTNWYPPSYRPRTGLMYVSVWDGYASIFKKEKSEYVPGRNFLGGSATPYTGVQGAPGVRVGRATPINTWTDAAGNGAVIAIDPQTGQKRWTFKQFDVTDRGTYTTQRCCSRLALGYSTLDPDWRRL